MFQGWLKGAGSGSGAPSLFNYSGSSGTIAAGDQWLGDLNDGQIFGTAFSTNVAGELIINETGIYQANVTAVIRASTATHASNITAFVDAPSLDNGAIPQARGTLAPGTSSSDAVTITIAGCDTIVGAVPFAGGWKPRVDNTAGTLSLVVATYSFSIVRLGDAPD